MNKVLLLIMIVSCSCARIPAESISLSDAMQSEAKRMHRLNIVLVQRMFSEKRDAVDAFIRNEYTPALVENFKKLLPVEADVKKDLAEIIQYITPAIQAKRDSLQQVLDVHEDNILLKLDEHYHCFEKGAEAMKRLLQSAIKLKNAKHELYGAATLLSNGKIDISKIEEAINAFIRNGGNVNVASVMLEQSITKILDQSN